MKILVTGASGFLGQNFVPTLKQKYKTATILCPNSQELDLLKEKMVADFLAKNQPEIIIHLATKMAGIGELLAWPKVYLEKNSRLNQNLVKHAVKNKVKLFATLGSSCSYNEKTPLPMAENSLGDLPAENTYGESKLQMWQALKKQKTMDWIYLIPSNLYGPRDHFGEVTAHLIPATILKLAVARRQKQKFIEVWGDGAARRDFIYVADLVKILLAVLEKPSFYNREINVASAASATVKEVVEKIIDLSHNETMKIHWNLAGPIGIKNKILSRQRFDEIWPDFKFTNLDLGLKKTLTWYQKFAHAGGEK